MVMVGYGFQVLLSLVEERRGEVQYLNTYDKKCEQRNSSGKSLCQKDTASFIRHMAFDNKTMKLNRWGSF